MPQGLGPISLVACFLSKRHFNLDFLIVMRPTHGEYGRSSVIVHPGLAPISSAGPVPGKTYTLRN
jgi:hypothetical protein